MTEIMLKAASNTWHSINQSISIIVLHSTIDNRSGVLTSTLYNNRLVYKVEWSMTCRGFIIARGFGPCQAARTAQPDVGR